MAREVQRTGGGPSQRHLLAALARSGLSPRTIGSYATDVRQYLSWVREHDLALLDGLTAWRDEMRRLGVKASTVNRKLAAVKRALRAAIEREPTDRRAAAETEIRAARSVRVVRSGVRPERMLTRTEVERLCRGMSRKGALLVRFLYATGCRVSEALGVRLTGIEERGARAEIEVSGKGGKARRVRVRSALLSEIRQAFGGQVLLFETSTHRPLARQYVSDMIARAARRVLGREGIGAHSLRHSFATALIKNGSGVQAVGEYLGHVDPATTLRFYVHEAVSDEELDRVEIGGGA